MQLPTEFAHITHPQRPQRDVPPRSISRALSQRNSSLPNVCIGQEAEQLAGTRPAQHENAALFGDIVDAHRFARAARSVSANPDRAVPRQRPTAHRSDRGPGGSRSFRRECARPADSRCTSAMPPSFARYLIRANAVEKGLGMRTADVVLGKAGQIENPDALVHRGDFARGPHRRHCCAGSCSPRRGHRGENHFGRSQPKVSVCTQPCA